METIKLNKCPVIFDRATHTYTLDGVILSGITSSIMETAGFGRNSKYADIPDSVLDEAARKGHELHEAVELYDAGGIVTDDRIGHYEKMKTDNGLVTIANEYLVSDLEHYASAIDVVFVNEAGEICIGDIKTTYNLDREAVRLQLSVYKWLFEMQNEHLKVSRMYAVWLPNKDHSLFELVELKPIDGDVLQDIISADISGKAYNHPAPDWLGDYESDILYWINMKKQADEQIERIKGEMKLKMEADGIKTVSSDSMTVTYSPKKTETRFDGKAFKEDNEDLYSRYCVEKKKEAFLTIKTK